MSEFTVHVETDVVTDDVGRLIDDAAAALEAGGAGGPAVIYDHVPAVLSATFQIEAGSAGAAVDRAIVLFADAIATAVGFRPARIKVDVEAEAVPA